MSEIGPDLEAEAKKTKFAKIKVVGKKAAKAAALTGRVALAAARIAIGPGDEIAAAILPTIANIPAEQRAAVLPSQDQLVMKGQQKIGISLRALNLHNLQTGNKEELINLKEDLVVKLRR